MKWFHSEKKQSISDINKFENNVDFNFLLLTKNQNALEAARKEILRGDHVIRSRAKWAEKPTKYFCPQVSRNFLKIVRKQKCLFQKKKSFNKADKDDFQFSYFYCDEVDTYFISYERIKSRRWTQWCDKLYNKIYK